MEVGFNIFRGVLWGRRGDQNRSLGITQYFLLQEFLEKLDELNSLFGDVHHIEVNKSSLELQSTWDWLNECLARLFIHSRLYQCSRFYGKCINLEEICPGGCELRKKSKTVKQKVRKRFKSVSKKASVIRAMSVTERNQEQVPKPNTTKVQESFVI